REAREGGAMGLHMFGALFLHAHDAQEIRDDAPAKRRLADALERMREIVYTTPFKPGHTPLAVVPNLAKILFHYYYEGEYDDCWALDVMDRARYFDRPADVPGVFSGGWYDPFAEDTTGQFAAMTRQNTTPQRLLIGPWNHGGMKGPDSTASGDVDFGEAARMGGERYNELRLRWFDRWLKGIENGVDDEPPARIFVMGGGTGRRTATGRLDHGGRWRDEREWPLARTRHVSYYLRSGGGLSPEPPGPSATEADPPASWTHDPEHPVPTIAA